MPTPSLSSNKSLTNCTSACRSVREILIISISLNSFSSGAVDSVFDKFLMAALLLRPWDKPLGIPMFRC